MTSTQTVTDTATAVHQYPCGTAGSVDMGNCDGAKKTTQGKCNVASGVDCTSETACSDVKGDFCRYISSSDHSGRAYDEPCVSVSGTPWGSCKHGITTANKTCSSDATCSGDLAEDYCAEGQPAQMCADSGLWCSDNSDCPGAATTDTCSGATSRMMTVKRALRRAMSEHADKVNFGFMSSYQGKGIGSSNLSTDIFPYVQLKSCPTSKNATETKLITRGELEKAGCLLSTGPTPTCMIDYGANGAVNSDPTMNQITYSLMGTTSDCPGSADSRWAIPRGDGSGKSSHVDATWASCQSSRLFPDCEFSDGTGLYEGSYYCFKFEQGTPIDNGNTLEEGSMKHPKYFPTYKGKFFSQTDTQGNKVCYNAIDAQRSDTVNDGIFGRPAYTGHPWDANNEVPVPWSGVTNAAACTEFSGAIHHSNVVPFLTDTTFGGKSLNTAQKLFMTTARLEKASFGGLAATGTVEPIACVLQNDGAANQSHSAAAYMSTVQTNDVTNNGNKTPCWPNSIVLVVDGQANGFGDEGVNVDCASDACAHSENADLFQNCACPAITKAYALAHSMTVQTHVVVNAPNRPNDGLSWYARYQYTYAFLNNLAKAGSLLFDGTATFGTTEDEVYRAISDKIAAAAYHFPYTTTTPVAGPTTQDPVSQLLAYSKYLYDTSVSYPSWKGRLVAYDTSSGTASFKWDSAGQAAAGHPANWTQRRIFFGDEHSNVKAVQMSSSDPATAVITNASELHSAGLGSTSAEADKIMQWLLGKPALGNP
ncbi:MAG TPA: hypothetical protein VMD51_15780, partial [Mycobacterium sp.]|nr:hypothetical protein [Mycobacterium sp.]